MNRADTVEQIRVVIEKVLSRPVSDLSEQTKLAELSLDSTSVLEMLMELEEGLGFEVEVDSLEPEVFTTVGTLTDYVEQRTAVS